jgi:hypothetical protein
MADMAGEPWEKLICLERDVQHMAKTLDLVHDKLEMSLLLRSDLTIVQSELVGGRQSLKRAFDRIDVLTKELAELQANVQSTQHRMAGAWKTLAVLGIVVVTLGFSTMANFFGALG